MYPVKLFSNNKFRILVLAAVAAACLSFIWLLSDYSSATRADIKHVLLTNLVSLDPPPEAARVDVVYILGGGQSSLEYKYRTVAELFRQGVTDRVWVLRREGHTEYFPSYGRNLSNDEWSLMTLESFGVPEGKVEFKKVDEGFFGTYSEAKDISEAAVKGNYKSVLLISSPSHTRRLKDTFQSFLKNEGITLYAVASEEKVLLRELVTEYFKLKIYHLFLIKDNLS